MTVTKSAEMIITKNEPDLEMLLVLYHVEYPQQLIILYTLKKPKNKQTFNIPPLNIKP